MRLRKPGRVFGAPSICIELIVHGNVELDSICTSVLVEL